VPGHGVHITVEAVLEGGEEQREFLTWLAVVVDEDAVVTVSLGAGYEGAG